MRTVYLIQFSQRTRFSDPVSDWPWQNDSVWQDRESAQADMERMQAESTDYRFRLEEVDFYPAGKTKD